MTQQYIVGELSCLLADLQPAPDERLGGAATALRREVEVSAPALLPELAREAIDLTETMCWLDLEQGDVAGFYRHAKAAAALSDFATGASLLP